MGSERAQRAANRAANRENRTAKPMKKRASKPTNRQGGKSYTRPASNLSLLATASQSVEPSPTSKHPSIGRRAIQVYDIDKPMSLKAFQYAFSKAQAAQPSNVIPIMTGLKLMPFTILGKTHTDGVVQWISARGERTADTIGVSYAGRNARRMTHPDLIIAGGCGGRFAFI